MFNTNYIPPYLEKYKSQKRSLKVVQKGSVIKIDIKMDFYENHVFHKRIENC